jgi:hypothetical protein
MSHDLDTRLKLFVYQTIAEEGRPPSRSRIAKALRQPLANVGDSLTRLRSQRLLALAPDSGEIAMAPPFSAVPTGFAVHTKSQAFHANCVWDAYGIAAALHQSVIIDAGCGCCGEPVRLNVTNGVPEPSDWVAHFAVPARQWWDDITFT